ncbi:centrosomal protein CCDC61 isoform X1 [Hydra vulgaris]|uniref:centrosomal protein CCDC61 isoform X1 n=1 Tax=Hydra vulgaris TaxID=6087 RepID=UPI001F5E90E4|nr:centrosomal protein CCDC61 [Hydra vulgaris]
MSIEKNSGTFSFFNFHGRDYKVDLHLNNSQLLVIHVDDCLTLDRWIGKYDASYIEELTHKTGNFKQFSIFCNMLESALSQNTDVVSLDLLTFDDLNALREQKIGSKVYHKKTNSGENKYKRYLIMTYTVEFDQIHYPLPLAYLGKNDSILMKNQFEGLKRKDQRADSDYMNANILPNKYEQLLAENENLKQELNCCYQQLKEVDVEAVLKDMKVLKKVVHNLENDLLTERNKHSRIMMKKKKEYDQLLEEFEELKATERNFRIRCKSLTEELATLKRSSRLSTASTSSSKLRNDKATLLARKHREISIENNKKDFIRNLQDLSKDKAGLVRSRTSSLDRRSQTSSLGKRSRTSSLEKLSIGRRTPSPNFIKFDPSAYVKRKEEKRIESENNLNRRRTPSSSLKKNISHKSASKKPPAGRMNDNSYAKKHSKKHLSAGSENTILNSAKSLSKKSYRGNYNIYDSDLSEDEKSQQLRRKSESPVRNKYLNNLEEKSEGYSIGIADIDARLAALQRFMENNME